MCDHGCHGVNDCAHNREQDTWLSSTLRPRPATQTRAERDQAPTDPPAPERASAGLPALTVAAFQAALRRDGGER